MSEDTPKQGALEKITPVLLVATIAMAFAVGVLWQKVSNFEKQGTDAEIQGAEDQAPVDLSGKLDKDVAVNIPPVTEDDHIRGSIDADVIVVEYSDFECPFCSSFHETVSQAIEEYGDSIAWVYRHFPLDTIHPRAIPAANASECAANLAGNEAFWNFVDYIFSNQETALEDEQLRLNAGRVGVDIEEYDNCIEEERFSSIVDEQYNAGAAAGVAGTPANFIINKNGEVWSLPGAVPLEDLKATIDEAMDI